MKEAKSNSNEKLSHKGDEPHLFKEIYRTYQVLMSGFSQKMGMTGARFSLMRLLALSDTDLGVMDMARRLDINAAAVTRQVKEMEREGLILKRADTKDARRSYIRLSSNGKKQFEEIHQRTHDLERTLASILGEKQMRDAATVLMKLRGIVEDFETNK